MDVRKCAQLRHLRRYFRNDIFSRSAVWGRLVKVRQHLGQEDRNDIRPIVDSEPEGLIPIETLDRRLVANDDHMSRYCFDRLDLGRATMGRDAEALLIVRAQTQRRLDVHARACMSAALLALRPVKTRGDDGRRRKRHLDESPSRMFGLSAAAGSEMSIVIENNPNNECRPLKGVR